MTVAVTLPTLGHRCNPSLYPPDFTTLYGLRASTGLCNAAPRRTLSHTVLSLQTARLSSLSSPTLFLGSAAI